MGQGARVTRPAQPDPKTPARIVNPSAGYAKLRHEQRCRLCRRTFWRGLGLTRHHLIPKGQGGDDVEANIVPLCGDGTRGCHGLVERSRNARAQLRHRLHADEVAYGVAKVGAGRFDRRYPKTA
jgi:hypothetical protein